MEINPDTFDILYDGYSKLMHKKYMKCASKAEIWEWVVFVNEVFKKWEGKNALDR
jgi:hypothetical protein